MELVGMALMAEGVAVETFLHQHLDRAQAQRGAHYPRGR